MSSIERRLARLEQAASTRETVHIWAGEEPLADVLAREFPDGVPNGVTVKTYCWADDLSPERDSPQPEAA
jgi:hypothetical protein